MKHFLDHLFSKMISQPPSGGCVLKLVFLSSGIEAASSRLQAAVC